MATDYTLTGLPTDGSGLTPGTGRRIGSGLDAPGFTHNLPPGSGAVPVGGAGTEQVPAPTSGGSYADNGTQARSGVPIGAAQLDAAHVTDGMTMPIPGDYPSHGASYPNIVVQPTHLADAGSHIAQGLRDGG
jgi:hypothetical protein